MDQLPCYSSLIPPPSYEASVNAVDESIWPRNYQRQTPRINVAKFYHDLVLNSPHQDENEYNYEYDDYLTKDYYRSLTEEEEEEEEEILPLSPPSSPTLQLISISQKPQSSSTSPFSSLLDHNHHHTITELNQLLLQTKLNSDASVPSYEAFKAKVNSHDLRPIPNTFP